MWLCPVVAMAAVREIGELSARDKGVFVCHIDERIKAVVLFNMAYFFLFLENEVEPIQEQNLLI